MTTDGPRLIRAAYTTETITVYQAGRRPRRMIRAWERPAQWIVSRAM
jgi:hypothetical protein